MTSQCLFWVFVNAWQGWGSGNRDTLGKDVGTVDAWMAGMAVQLVNQLICDSPEWVSWKILSHTGLHLNKEMALSAVPLRRPTVPGDGADDRSPF